MTINRPASRIADIAITPAELSPSARQRIFLYLGILIILLAFGGPSGGLIDIPISFLLKNKLKLSAHEVAVFRLVAAVPLYLSFAFGFIRDIWSPFGMGDRGFMLLFGAISALLYVFFAFTSVTYVVLIVAIVMLTASCLFIVSAQNGLTAMIGRQHAMTGQISAAWNVFLSIPTVAALLAGGALSGLLEDKGADTAIRILFLAAAAIMGVVAVYSIWRPSDVFDNVRIERRTAQHPLADLQRLVRHWPLYSALLIWLLWNFAPGSTTPLQYHLQNTLSLPRMLNGVSGTPSLPPPLFYSGLYPLWNSLPMVCAKSTPVVGNLDRHPADDSVAVYTFNDGRSDRRGADRPYGRHCHRCVSGSDHPGMPAWTRGDDPHVDEQFVFSGHPIR
jgi:hypothetical protein